MRIAATSRARWARFHGAISYRKTTLGVKIMTLQTIKLEDLQAGKDNPRKAINQASIEGLADSIKNDGVLQNLVVKPIKGKGKGKKVRYRIVAG